MIRSYSTLVGFVILCALALFHAVSAAIGFINAPSTASVLFGGALLFCCLCSLPLMVLWGMRLGRRAVDSMRKVATGGGSRATLFILLASSAVNPGCGCSRIDAGHVGIVVNLAGDQRGVQDLPAQTGWVFYNPFGTQVFEYPTFVQTVQWTKDVHEGNPANEEITFTTKDGLAVSADVSLSYQLQRDLIPAFYVKFRSDDLKQFTHGFLRNVTRDQFNEVASKYAIESIIGDNEAFITDVRKRLSDAVAPVGVQVQQFGFIGAPRPPQSVIDAINAKIGATQQAMQVENEVRRVKAEAEKRVAQAEGAARAAIVQAEGEAKARRITADSEAYTNRVVSASITPVLNDYLRAKRWDGKMPTVSGSGGSIVSLGK